MSEQLSLPLSSLPPYLHPNTCTIALNTGYCLRLAVDHSRNQAFKMRSRSLFTSLSLSSLLLLAEARPLFLDALVRRDPASYSVVAVDGGSSGGDTAPATTVTDAVTHTQTTMMTQLSTVVITQAETPTTIIFTVTSPSPTTVTDYPPASITTHVVTATPEAPIPAAPSSQVPSISIPSWTMSYGAQNTPTDTSSPVTATVTTAQPSTVPYDDGMWHTYYFHTVDTEGEWSATSTSESSPTSPTTTSIPDFWSTPVPYVPTVSVWDYSAASPTTTSVPGFWEVPAPYIPTVSGPESSTVSPTSTFTPDVGAEQASYSTTTSSSGFSTLVPTGTMGFWGSPTGR